MNNDQHPLLGALGLCRKAGKLVMGFDPAAQSMLWCCSPQMPATARSAI